METAVICVTVRGMQTGRVILENLENAVLFVPEHLTDTPARPGRIIRFKKPLSSITGTLMEKYTQLIFVMATGIVVRHIAPFIVDKRTDPAVVVLDEKGIHVISLLSGHLGGANALALQVASCTKGTPVITTASDIHNKPAIDLVAKSSGCVIENPDRIPAFMRAFLDGDPVGVFDPEKKISGNFEKYKNVIFFNSVEEAEKNDKLERVLVSNERYDSRKTKKSALLLRPRNIIAGIGCRRGVLSSEIEEAFSSACEIARVSRFSLNLVATVDLKKNETGLLEFSEKHGVQVRFFSANEIQAETGNAKEEGQVKSLIGVSGVCEPCAALAGGRGRLLLKKTKYKKKVTIALALAGGQ
ncbi:MAG: cobalt-precorrin 5A hydrolase [Nitrospinota bacterium]